MKPKEWLLSKGHIKEIGRGRLSAENIARIKEAVSSGVVIEGYSVSAKPAANTSKPEVQRTTSETGIASIPEQRRNPDEWEPFDDTGARIMVGIKGICDNCNSSFTYCYCRHSVKMLDGGRVSVVTFKPTRKGTS